MPIDPQQVGFAWSEETALTNTAGETMTVRPFAANFAGLREAGGQRIEECYRYYTSSRGILTELELKKWLAGGDEACARLLSAFRALFGSQPGTRLSLSSVLSSLQAQGFPDATISINLRWLLQDGYVAAERDGDDWQVEVVKW